MPVQAQTPALQGRVAEGKTAWALPLRCANCHGAQGEGGYGPDLAGRGLSFESFRRAVRQPWGIMPAYSDGQLSDQTLADIYAFLTSLPPVSKVGTKEHTAPPGAPIGQVYMIESYGCASCHGPEILFPRQVLGGADGTALDFEHFEKLVYEHSSLYAQGRMGNYSRHRMPEPILREMFRFIKDDLGLLVPMTAVMSQGASDGANTTYTLTIRNTGTKGRGLTAEEITVIVMLPPAAKLVGATGIGYQGVQSNARGDHDALGPAATWRIERLAASDELRLQVTLAGPPANAADLFKESIVQWMKPVMRPGARTLVLRDYRNTRDDAYRPVTFQQGVRGGAPPPAQP
jgi:mono/diheme cytochrome c family protein